MAFCVYVLRNPNGKQYIGQTADLESRLSDHREGLSAFTSRHRPWDLVYVETFESRREAMIRERYLKTGAGRDWLARKLKGTE